MFITLNLNIDKKVTLNMDKSFLFTEFGNITEIDFGNGFVVRVKETPEEILGLIKEAKLKNGELQAQAIYDMFYSILIQKL